MKKLAGFLVLMAAGCVAAPLAWSQSTSAMEVQAEVIYVGPDRVPSTPGTPDDQLEVQIKMTNVTEQVVRRSAGRVEVLERASVLRGYNFQTDTIPPNQSVLVSIRHRVPLEVIGTGGVTPDIARRFGARAQVTSVTLEPAPTTGGASQGTEEEELRNWRIR